MLYNILIQFKHLNLFYTMRFSDSIESFLVSIPKQVNLFYLVYAKDIFTSSFLELTSCSFKRIFIIEFIFFSITSL